MANEKDLPDLELPDLDVPAKPEELSNVDYIKGLGRTVAQGGTLAFSDEAIAAARAILEKGKFEEKLKEEREALEKFKSLYPKAAFGAELAGGVLTGGALGKVAGKLGAIAPKAAETIKGLSLAGAAEVPVYKTAIHGAAMGALEGIGKTEDKTSMADLAENIQTGAAWGAGMGAGTKAVTKTIQKFLPKSFAEAFPAAKTAHEFKTEKGYPLTSEQANIHVFEEAKKLADKFDEARGQANKRIKSFLHRADEAGATVKIPEKTVDILRFRANLAGQIDGSFLQKLLARTDYGVYDFKPSEIANIKNILNKMIDSTSDAVPGAVAELKDAKKVIKGTLSDSLPGYQELVDSSRGLYQAIEKIVLKGGEAGQRIDKENVVGRFSTRGKNVSHDVIRQNFNQLFQKGSLDNFSQKQYGYAVSELRKALGELELKEKSLIHKGIIPLEDSFFLKNFNGNTKQIIDKIQKESDIGAAQVFSGTIRGTEEQAPGKELAKFSVSRPLSWLPEKAIQIAEELPDSPTLRIMGKLVEGVGLKAPNMANSVIHNLPDWALGSIAGSLGNYQNTKPYSDKLKQAIENNDTHSKNTTLFALRTNPTTREILNNELTNFGKELVDADRSVDFSSREKEPESSGIYQTVRNNFLIENETGRGGQLKKDFYSYKDSGGLTTIGHGFNMDAPGNIEKLKDVLNLDDREVADIYSKKRSITKEQADALFNSSLENAEKILDKKIKDYGVTLNPNERAALISMVYNNPSLVGPKILTALKNNNKVEAAKLIAISSDHQADDHPGLPIRRRKEAKLFLKPFQTFAKE